MQPQTYSMIVGLPAARGLSRQAVTLFSVLFQAGRNCRYARSMFK